MQNKYILGIVALGLIALLGVGLVTANGFGGKFGTLSDEDKEAMQEQRQAMHEAIENEDYETWKTLMEEKAQQMGDRINEENFEAMKTKHEERAEIRNQFQAAKEAGDYETIENLKEQYGFGKGMGRMGKGFSECPLAE